MQTKIRHQICDYKNGVNAEIFALQLKPNEN